jgi:short subunit dehydrogenase-like uncharacterized protein
MSELVVYGSYGYTGSLIAEAAVDRGMEPLLAGRERRSLESQAARLRTEFEVVGLDEPKVLDMVLDEAEVVLNCAGPFSRTWTPMVDACLRTGTHYLDITGEISVFEAIHERSAAAAAEDVMLLPGTGFDVVPTDCLGAHLAEALPDADRLELAFRAEGGISRGTAKTMLEHIEAGGAVRRGGDIQGVPLGHESRTVDFGWGHGGVYTTAVPWGDVSTAYYTTGIPNTTVYTAIPESIARIQRVAGVLSPVLGLEPVTRALQWYVERTTEGPDAEERRQGRSYVWGEVQNPDGDRAVARVRGPHTYALTVETALACARRALSGDAEPGFQTPAGVYGPDLILDVDGVERENATVQ